MRMPTFKSKTVLLLAAVGLLLAVGLIWLGYPPARVKVERGNERFGLAFVSPPDQLADEARYAGALMVGARWDRWPLYWHWVAEGGYTGSHAGGQHDYDRLVAEEIERGIEPLVILMGTPAELARPLDLPESPAQAAPARPLRTNPLDVSTATLPPASLTEPIFSDGTDEPGRDKPINPANAWAKFVFTTVERYRPGGVLAGQQRWARDAGVRHWEVWNEPDFRQFWAGSVEDYYRLLEVAYKSIKAADPDAVVLVGGLAFYEQPNWLGQLLQQTGGDPGRAYFDALAVHHYWSIYYSEARLIDVRATLVGYNLDHIPIWMTESGLSVWDDYPATAHQVSPDTPWRGAMTEQAAYVIEHPALVLFHGVERYFHFMLHDDCGDGPSTAFGLRQNFSPHVCSPAQGQPRPAYSAYQLVTDQFRDMQPLWRRRTTNADQVAFYRPDDRSRVLVVWSTEGLTATVTITATGEIAQLYWIEPERLAGSETFRREATWSPVEDRYSLTLPPATNRNNPDPFDPRYHIGGRPYVLVESDTQAPTATITRVVPVEPSTYLVKWLGQDMGSGVAGYDVWAGQDEGPLALWLSNTADMEAQYEGDLGHTYHFAVRARDQAGNEGPAPTAAQASTGTISTTSVTGVVLGPNREPVSGATVDFDGADTLRSLTTTIEGAWAPALLIPGDYAVQASAPAYGVWPAPRRVQLESATRLLLTLAPPDNAIIAGDFEGNEVWQHWAWAGQVDLFFRAFDGEFAARLGQGRGEEVTCRQGRGQRWSIQQQVTVPAAGEPVLSFVRRIATPRPRADAAWLDVAVITDSTSHPLIPPGELWQPSDWTLTAVDLDAWRGQTVDVMFQVVRCSEQPFTVSLDRVSLGNLPDGVQ